MAEQVGEIYYDVDIRTQEFVSGAAKLDDTLDKLDKSMSDADKSAKGLGTQMTKTAAGVKAANGAASQAQSAFGGLYKILAAYIGLQSLKTLTELSDEYGQMASRVKQVTKDTAEYERVQARLLQTANATYRPLAEAQEVFIRTADSIRDLGYTTDQALDITDSFSFLLVTNAASADRANSAISAYSKSIQTGKISSDEWQSILAAMPTIVDGISDATGRSREEIKKLGVEGKLSLDALNEGLRRSRDANEALAAEMETSVKDAFTALRNSLQVFVGKVNETSGATGILTGAVGDLAEILQDPATIKAAQDLAAGVVLALSKIIEAVKETVGFVQWGAEELAAAFGGIAGDDIVRLEAKAQQLTESLAGMMDAGYSNKPIFARQSKELDELNAKIEAYYKLQAQLQRGTGTPPPTAVSTVTSAPPTTVGAEVPSKPKKAKKTDEQKAADQNREALEKLQQQLTGTSLASRDLAQYQAQLKLNEYATPEQIEMIRQVAAELWDANEGAKMLASADPLAGEQQRFEQQLENLRTLNEAKLLEDQRYLELKAQAERAHDEQMRVLQEENFRRQSVANELLLASLDQLQQGATNALVGLVTGANNSEEAIRGLATSILNEAVGALVQMGVQQVKNLIMGQTAAAAATAAGVAQGSVLAAAYAPAAALASLASFGANAVPAQAGIATTMATTKALAVAGGRQYGGPVSTGNMYRINENGAPEVFQAANGRQFMLPNTRGEVVSNKDATAQGAQPVQVSVNLYESQSKAGTVEQRSDESGQFIDVFVADIMGNGKAAQALQGTYGMRRVGR